MSAFGMKLPQASVLFGYKSGHCGLEIRQLYDLHDQKLHRFCVNSSRAMGRFTDLYSFS